MASVESHNPKGGKLPTVWHVGAEDVFMRIPLLLKLREKGFKVGAVGSAEDPRFAEHDIPFYRYPLAKSARPWSEYRSRRSLALLFREHQPDVIHAFDTRPAILGPLAAKKAGVPGRVRTVTGMGRLFSSDSPATRALRTVYRSIQRKVSANCLTVFQNEDDHEYFLTHKLAPLGQDALVPGSGIDLDALQRAASNVEANQAFRSRYQLEGRLVVTMVARLEWQKGVREFLEAAQRLGRERQDVVFLLVGPLGAKSGRFVSKGEIQSYEPVVKYLGSRDDVPTILSATDLFVLPSYYREGVPRALLEAGALGVPLITTDMPGCRDVVRHEREGLLIPPRNVDSLADAMRRALDSPELRERFGCASRERIENRFSLDQVAAAYAEIYQRSLRAA